MRQQFKIVPASSVTVLLIIGFGALILCTLIPAWLSHSRIVMIAIVIVVFLLLSMFIWIGYSARNARFIVSSSGLTIRADMYSRQFPLADMQRERAAVINLEEQDAYRPVMRTNGVGMPGYGSGWFTLKNGDKALAFITSKNAVVRIPTKNGYCLLLSVSDPHDFIAALQNIS